MKRTLALSPILLAVAVPVGVCLGFAADPLRARDEPEWLLVTPLDELVYDGAPRRFTVLREGRDAWTRGAPQPAASVFVQCEGESVTVFPAYGHMGCALEYDAEAKTYKSCCFNVTYDLDGAVSPSAAGFSNLAPLPIRIEHGGLSVRLDR